jgi:hypothetical protein
MKNVRVPYYFPYKNQTYFTKFLIPDYNYFPLTSYFLCQQHDVIVVSIAIEHGRPK